MFVKFADESSIVPCVVCVIADVTFKLPVTLAPVEVVVNLVFPL